MGSQTWKKHAGADGISVYHEQLMIITGKSKGLKLSDNVALDFSDLRQFFSEGGG